jgi:predicted Zn-dependent protease
MAEQREGMITVRSDLGNYMEEIDQYTAQLPLTIREQMRQALYREYESDYAAQESLCREMLEAAPGNADVLEMLGRCLIAQGRPAEAVPYLTEAHSANPDEQNTAISLGQAYQMLQEYKKAVQVFAEVDPPTEHHPFFYSAYGECLENLGQRE